MIHFLILNFFKFGLKFIHKIIIRFQEWVSFISDRVNFILPEKINLGIQVYFICYFRETNLHPHNRMHNFLI